jgi:hypothetical protein
MSRRLVAWLLIATPVCVLRVGAVDHALRFDRQASPQTETFKVLSVAAGPSGAEANGKYVLDQIRSRFNRQRDSQVVVYFRWDGTPGRHRLAARWRSPGGSVSTQSEFEYEARDREFGAYWNLPLSASTPVGRWSVEALIDGLPSGSLAFEITDDDVEAGEPSRRPLAHAQLFERARAAFLIVERSATPTMLHDQAGGLVLAPGLVATTFPAVDATDTLHVRAPGGPRQPATSVAAWDRRQGWAILAATVPGRSPLPASSQAAGVGERCFSITGDPSGSHVLVEGTVVGNSEVPGSGRRYVANFFSGATLPGSPVLNEYGDLIGIVGGIASEANKSLRQIIAESATGGGPQNRPVIPVTSLPSSQPSEIASIDDLRRRGVLMAPVTGDHVMSGGFARQISSRPTPHPVDQRDEFAVREAGSMYAFVTWDPKARLRGVAVLRMYDEENHALVESAPKKADLKPGNLVWGQWQVPLPARPGQYRVDVVLGDATYWRRYFLVRE